MRSILFAVLSTAILATSGIHVAVAAPPTTFEFQDDFFVLDDCTGENIHFVGTTSGSFAFSSNENTVHFIFHAKVRVDGIGLSTGASYFINTEQNTESNTNNNNGGFEMDQLVNEQIIGKGATANESIKRTYHITFHNGTIVIERSNFSFSCHG